LASIVFKTLSGEAEEAMKERSAKEMVMENIDELVDAEDAMLIITHKDGSISWHETRNRISMNLGLVSYVKVCLEEEVRQTSEIDEQPMPKEVLH
jgi:hypothetical protein